MSPDRTPDWADTRQAARDLADDIDTTEDEIRAEREDHRDE